MHIPDGFISGHINVATTVIAVGTIGYALSRLKQEISDQPHKVPLLATTAAFVFAAQMLNFPIGGGTSGHFLGAVTAAALMGPWAAIIIMTLVLIIQALFFADGGVTALGTNILNMAIIGGLGGYMLMRGIRAVLPFSKAAYLTSVAIASWASVVLASAFCAIELALSNTSPLQIALPAMLATHAVIGIGEALIACAVITAVIAAHSAILHDYSAIFSPNHTHSHNLKRTGIVISVGMVLALSLAVIVSPYASSNPDGLEKVAEEQGFIEHAASEENSAWQHSLFPDYSVQKVERENLSTSLAGFIGTGLVFVVGFIVIRVLRRRTDTESVGK